MSLLGRKIRKAGDPLTARQQEVLDAMREHLRRNGSPPTIRELANIFGLANNTGVVGHINALVDKGRVRRIADSGSRVYIPIVPEGCCSACGRRLDGNHSPTDEG